MKDILNKLTEHRCLSRDEARAILQDIAEGRYNDAQTASLITVFLMRDISVDELCGFRDALLEMRHPRPPAPRRPRRGGRPRGGGRNTFNISTAASFVVAAAGLPVAKHGNYGATSVSGASNVIERMGVRFTADEGALRRSMDGCRLAYLHAPLFNPAMKAVAPVRKALGVRTFFNILGPLVNPALPAAQLLGVYNLALQRLYTYTYQAADTTRFAVVHSLDGYDEISLTSDFKVSGADGEQIYRPETLGLARLRPEELYGGATPDEAADIFRRVLENRSTAAQKQAVVANAAFAIRLMRPDAPLPDCIAEATETIDSGRALQTLKRFVELNQ